MEKKPADPSVMKYLRACLGRDPGGESDGTLLDRYVATQDSSAFELLVYRHSTLVQKVCRTVLHDHHAAEDAAQATFLALALGAKSIGGKRSIVGWLHCVARRVALRHLGKQRKKQDATPVEELAEREPASPSNGVLHEEVEKLPEKLREPILLCYFEGLTYEEAAKRLGWPIGTLNGRMALAKQRLHERLTRRGWQVTVAMLGGLLTADTTTASAEFVQATVRAASVVVSGSLPAGSTISVDLARGVLRTMFMEKCKWVATVATTVTMAFAVTVSASAYARLEPPREGLVVPQIVTTMEVLAPRPNPEKNKVRPAVKYQSPSKEVIQEMENATFISGDFARKESNPYDGTGLPGLNPYLIKTSPFRDMASFDNCIFVAQKHEESSIPAFRLPLFVTPGKHAIPEIGVPFGFYGALHSNGAALCKELQINKDFLVRLDLTLATGINDKVAEDIKELVRLEALILQRTQIGDDGMKALKKLPRLKVLSLAGTQITDEVAQHLQECFTLEELDLSGTQITDKAVAKLATMKSLTRLDLSSTAVTDAGIAALEKCDTLTHLNLAGTKIGDESLKSLIAIKNLSALNLSGSKVTKEGLPTLSGATKLTQLALCQVAADDEAVEAAVHKMLSLETLDLAQTQVQGKVFGKLKKLPTLRTVHYSPNPGAMALPIPGRVYVDPERLAEFCRECPKCSVLPDFQTGAGGFGR